jgi:hypothetical protein
MEIIFFCCIGEKEVTNVLFWLLFRVMSVGTLCVAVSSSASHQVGGPGALVECY